MITTVKYQADIQTPTTYTGYIVNGSKSVPMAQGNRDYREVQKWMTRGNIPQPAYTSQQLEEYTINTLKNVNREYLANTDWYVIRENETGKKIPEEIANKRRQARLNI